MTIFVFDLDGVLVDNLRFEHAVTLSITHTIAHHRQISETQAAKLWRTELDLFREHPRWHDYAFHCHRLGIGDSWRNAHLQHANLLSTYPGTTETIKYARERGCIWIASDATQWVVQFKLQCVGLNTIATKFFSVDNCKSNKSSPAYWSIVRAEMTPNARVCYIENRIDRLVVGVQNIPNAIGVLIDEADHPQECGFATIAEVPQGTHRCNHAELPEVLATLVH